MKRKTFFYVCSTCMVVLVVVLCGYFFKSNSKKSLSEDNDVFSNLEETTNLSETNQNNNQKIINQHSSSTQDGRVKPFTTSPDPSSYEEKMDHTNVLDSRLRPFVKEIAQAMREAKDNEDRAVEVFQKLKECSLSEPSQELFVVRASCAENLKTLSKLYPNKLAGEYNKVEARFSEDIKKAMF